MAKILFDGIEYSKLYFNTTTEIKTINFTDSTGTSTSVILECAHTNMTSEIITAATCQLAGRRKYTCTDCGYSYEELIPKTAHIYVGGKCKKCGQSQIGSIVE